MLHIILSYLKTLLTLKSFLGIISDVSKPNEEHCLTAEGILGKGLIFMFFFNISIIISPPSATTLLLAAAPFFGHRSSYGRYSLLQPPPFPRPLISPSAAWAPLLNFFLTPLVRSSGRRSKIHSSSLRSIVGPPFVGLSERHS